MIQQLEKVLSGSDRINKDSAVYTIKDLNSLSASVLYSGEVCGNSNFTIELSDSNGVNKGISISSPQSTVVCNSYKRIIGKSGIDYFNFDDSLAARLKNLSKSELLYLKNK